MSSGDLRGVTWPESLFLHIRKGIRKGTVPLTFVTGPLWDWGESTYNIKQVHDQCQLNQPADTISLGNVSLPPRKSAVKYRTVCMYFMITYYVPCVLKAHLLCYLHVTSKMEPCLHQKLEQLVLPSTENVWLKLRYPWVGRKSRTATEENRRKIIQYSDFCSFPETLLNWPLVPFSHCQQKLPAVIHLHHGGPAATSKSLCRHQPLSGADDQVCCCLKLGEQ